MKSQLSMLITIYMSLFTIDTTAVCVVENGVIKCGQIPGILKDFQSKRIADCMNMGRSYEQCK